VRQAGVMARKSKIEAQTQVVSATAELAIETMRGISFHVDEQR